MKVTLHRKFFAGLALLAGLPVWLNAVTIEWSNAAGGEWSTPANWTGGVAPTVADIGDVSISISGGVVTNSVQNQAVLSLRYLATSGDLTFSATGSGSYLIQTNGDIRNNTISTTANFNFSAPVVFNPASGTGTANVSFYSNEGVSQATTGTSVFSGSVTAATTTATARLSLTGSNKTAAANLMSGLISDGGAAGGMSVLKTGSGNWTMTNSGNTFSGGVTVGSGGLYVASIGNAGSASVLGTNGTVHLGATTTSATFVYTGTGETTNKTFDLSGTTGSISFYSGGTGALNLTGNFTASGAGVKLLTLRGNGATSYVNTLSGSIVDSSGGATNFAKNDGNIWSLSGANTYTGTTAANSGSLVIAKQQALYNGNTASWTTAKISVGANATFAVGVGDAASGYFDAAALATLLDGSHLGASTATTGFKTSSNFGLDTTNATGGTYTYATALTDIGTSSLNGLNKLGTGTLVLSAANTYTGTTTVTAGTLLVDGSIGSGLVSVNGTSTLGGSGTIGGTTTITANSFLAPGDGGSAGVLTFSNNLTLAGTTTMLIDGTSRGSGYAGLNVGGTLTYGGTLALTFGTTLANGDTFNLFSDLSGTAAPTFQNNLAAVNLSGSGYNGSLALDAGVWSAVGINGATFNLDPSTGILSVSGIAAVPEPSTYAALAGLLALALAAVRRRRCV